VHACLSVSDERAQERSGDHYGANRSLQGAIAALRRALTHDMRSPSTITMFAKVPRIRVDLSRPDSPAPLALYQTVDALMAMSAKRSTSRALGAPQQALSAAPHVATLLRAFCHAAASPARQRPAGWRVRCDACCGVRARDAPCRARVGQE
jgi:hypothetical protein